MCPHCAQRRRCSHQPAELSHSRQPVPLGAAVTSTPSVVMGPPVLVRRARRPPLLVERSSSTIILLPAYAEAVQGDPSIILVSGDHGDILLEEFRSRYDRDYDLRVAHGAGEAEAVAQEICDGGGMIALFVSDSRLPDVDHVFEAIHRWRQVIPTARKVITAHWDNFVADGPPLRIGLAKGKYDAYLLMPRGRRDEEFHNAITDLLSDWGSTVPQPEVVSAKILSPRHDGLTMAIRDLLDRMGMPNKVWDPADPVIQEYVGMIKAQLGVDELRYPVVYAANRVPIQATSVRDVAVSFYGRPGDFQV